MNASSILSSFSKYFLWTGFGTYLDVYGVNIFFPDYRSYCLEVLAINSCFFWTFLWYSSFLLRNYWKWAFVNFFLFFFPSSSWRINLALAYFILYSLWRFSKISSFYLFFKAFDFETRVGLNVHSLTSSFIFFISDGSMTSLTLLFFLNSTPFFSFLSRIFCDCLLMAGWNVIFFFSSISFSFWYFCNYCLC